MHEKGDHAEPRSGSHHDTGSGQKPCSLGGFNNRDADSKRQAYFACSCGNGLNRRVGNDLRTLLSW